MPSSLLPASSSSSLSLILSLLKLEKQLCKVPICGRIVTASSYSGFPTVSFHFPFRSLLLLVSIFAAHSFASVAKFFFETAMWNLAHSFPSPACAFYFFCLLFWCYPTTFFLLLSSIYFLSTFQTLPPFCYTRVRTTQTESKTHIDTHTHTHTSLAI